MSRARNLVVVLGDQLSHRSAAFDHFGRTQDIVRMTEDGSVTFVAEQSVGP